MRIAAVAPWTIRGSFPGLRAAGTVVASSLADARTLAVARWPDVARADLRVQRAAVLPHAILLEALAADGSRLA